jgi:hypothetical protein
MLTRRSRAGLNVYVRPRRLDWGADDGNVGAGEHGVEGGELGIAVADQEPELLGVVAKVDQQVAGLFSDPRRAGGMGGDPAEVYAAQEDGVDVGEVDREDRLGAAAPAMSTLAVAMC